MTPPAPSGPPEPPGPPETIETIELISSKGCPYGLACLAALCAAGLRYTLTEVPLRAIPDWVVQLTPSGQVPVLRVGEGVFFESTAICELVNDLAGGVLLPPEPLARAWMRSWSRYVSTLSPLLFQAIKAATRDAFDSAIARLDAAMKPLEQALVGAPAAAAGRIQLVDCAFYAVFTRLLHLEAHVGQTLVDAPRLRGWAQAATAAIGPLHPVLGSHGERLIRHYARAGGYLSAPDVRAS